MAIENAANNLDELLDKFVEQMVDLDAAEDNSAYWENLKKLIESREKLDKINLENWKQAEDVERKDAADKRANRDKKIDFALRGLDIVVKAGSIVIPPAVMIYFTALNLKAEDDGVLIRNDPAMKYMEKLIGNIGKFMK